MMNINSNVQKAIVVALILAASIQYTTLSNSVGYSIMAFLYSVIIFQYLLSNQKFHADKKYVFMFLLISFISTIGSLMNMSTGTSIRVLALLIFTSINIFILPKIISFDSFVYIVPRISILFIIAGLLPLFHLPDSILFLDLSFWSSSSLIPFLPIITSIYSNPNTLGFVLFLGSTLSFAELYRKRNKSLLVLFFVLFIGLILSNNRSGIIGFMAAISLIMLANSNYRKYTTVVLINTLIATFIFLLALFGLIPGTHSLTDISLNGRRVLWSSGVSTFLNNPTIGYGLEYGGTHNSFIRMFAALGIFGGLAYVIMYVSILVQNTKNMQSYMDVVLSSLLVGSLYVQLFEGGSFIGVSIHSTMISLFMGYYITRSV